MNITVTVIDKSMPAPLACAPVKLVLDTNNPLHIESLRKMGYESAPYPAAFTITIRNK